MDSIRFGIDWLGKPSKIAKIYLSVKGRLYKNEDYQVIWYSGLPVDANIIDYLTNFEGSKRVVVTGLISSGYRFLYPNVKDIRLFEASLLISTVGLYLPFIEFRDLKLPLVPDGHDKNFMRYRSINIYSRIPLELYGIVSALSRHLNASMSRIVLYLIRAGAVDYKDFVSSFGSANFEINEDYIKFCDSCRSFILEYIHSRVDEVISKLKSCVSVYSDKLPNSLVNDIKKFLEGENESS